MTTFFKYLPTSLEDEKWGLYVMNTGCDTIAKHGCYPPPGHPANHHFNWAKGRILDEYQLIYITKGEGLFESIQCAPQTVKEGSVMILFPGEWHRYKPNFETGWDEYWVGFNGSVISNITQHFFARDSAVLEVGLHDVLLRLFTEIIDKTREEKTGYQPLVAGIVMHLLGEIHSLARQQDFSPGDNTGSIIRKATIILRTNIDNDISIEQVAEQLNVSYSWFRKAFKNYTGLAPHRYLLQLRIEKAKMLLADHTVSIKEIAFLLNFESAFYFSRLFKEKTGLSPEAFRKNMEH
jgi:AraC-like DNA-binding protein